MENAIDALKIAFGMFVFVIAISVTVRTFQKTKETADIMLARNDKTSYIEYEEGSLGEKERIVGLETIIPTLYKYYKEDYMVVFRHNNGSPYKIYTTKTNDDLWANSYKDTYIYKNGIQFNANNGRDIACFDVEEETARREPWTANADIYFKRNLDAILNGNVFKFPDNSGREYDYSSLIGYGGLIEKLKEKQFREYIGEKVYEVKVKNDTTDTNMMRKNKKRVIIYEEYIK